jgi:Zn-dependent protease
MLPGRVARTLFEKFRMGAGFKLFRVFGITVHLHWTWFLVAAFFISRPNGYEEYPLLWATAQCLAFFLLLLAHSLGMSLAYRTTGGVVESITIWALGTFSDFEPPNRPTASLWVYSAGGLVNGLLMIPLAACFYYSGGYDAVFVSNTAPTSIQRFTGFLVFINIVLLIFNYLPVYPLNGGQIARALLWYGVGRWRSLQVAAGIGALACLAGIGFFIAKGQYFIIIVCIFGLYTSFTEYRYASVMLSDPYKTNE